MNGKTYHLLAFDCGATSGRGMLGTVADGHLTMREVCRFPNAMLELGGRYYWNVYNLYEHILRCLSQLAQEGVALDAIGIDTWGVDFGLVGDDGALLSLPRAYRDPYTEGVVEQVFRIVPREELYAITGIQTMSFNTIFQWYAQQIEGNTALRHAHRLLFMPDLLTYMLTGQAVCEYTVASTSGLLNPLTRQFELPLLERLGLDARLLPSLVQPGTVVGALLPAIARTTGVGSVPVVAVAGHDTASAVAALSGKPQGAFLSSGTWSLMGIVTPEPILTPRAAELNFTNEGGIDGTTRFLKNITGFWLVEQCRRQWQQQGRNYSYPEMVQMAQSAVAYPGRIAPDDPRYAHPHDMDGEICRALAEQGFPAPHDDAEMLSCIYHSLAHRYREVLTMLQEFAPFAIRQLHVIGGGAANQLLNRWTEEAIGIPVVAGPTEATAWGNLVLQARTLNIPLEP